MKKLHPCLFRAAFLVSIPDGVPACLPAWAGSCQGKAISARFSPIRPPLASCQRGRRQSNPPWPLIMSSPHSASGPLPSSGCREPICASYLSHMRDSSDSNTEAPLNGFSASHTFNRSLSASSHSGWS